MMENNGDERLTELQDVQDDECFDTLVGIETSIVSERDADQSVSLSAPVKFNRAAKIGNIKIRHHL